MRLAGSVLFFALFFVSSTVYGDAGDRLYDRARAQYLSGKNTSSDVAKRRAYFFSASELRKFVHAYEGHAKIPDAYFNLGSIYRDLTELTHDSEDAKRSVKYFRQVVATDPKSRLADDALFEEAKLCESRLKDKTCAERARERIRHEYASGDMAQQLGSPNLASSKPSSVDPQGPSSVTGLNLQKLEGKVSFRVNLSAPREFTQNTLAANQAYKLPARFFIDIPEAKLETTSDAVDLPSGLPISRVRFGQNTKNVVRVVFDLAKGTDPSKVQAQRSADGIEVQILSEGESRNVVSSPSEKKKVDSPIPWVTPVVVATPKPKQAKRVIIVDAGHGGEDPGATGPRGTKEKDICLAIAQRVRRMLEARSEYEVHMTRKDDRFIELIDRTRLANKWQGDLFVSIHANASPRRSARGVSTYFLDNADDAESLRVAERENGVIRKVSKDKGTRSDEYMLEITKASMAKTFHTTQSSVLAATVQSAMMKNLSKKYREVHDVGVRSAQFFVLTGAEMPAILVETSFVSNREEEKRLREPRYQNLLAEAIVRGIDAFFESPQGRGDHSALYQQK